MTLEELAEEAPRGFPIPALLRQHIKHLPAFIDRAPQVHELAVDLAEKLLKVPRSAGLTALAPKPIGISSSEFQTPQPDRFLRDFLAALQHHLLTIPTL
jgi:hypothetical protein